MPASSLLAAEFTYVGCVCRFAAPAVKGHERRDPEAGDDGPEPQQPDSTAARAVRSPCLETLPLCRYRSAFVPCAPTSKCGCRFYVGPAKHHTGDANADQPDGQQHGAGLRQRPRLLQALHAEPAGRGRAKHPPGPLCHDQEQSRDGTHGGPAGQAGRPSLCPPPLARLPSIHFGLTLARAPHRRTRRSCQLKMAPRSASGQMG
eukprot:scaffold255795_cov39-Prasinocladus_malaysianus.AAC.1